MAEYIYTNLPQFVKTNSRTEFSSSVVSSGAVLLFSENGSSLTAKLPDGSFVEVGGSSGTDVSPTTAEAGDVLSGKVFFTSGGVQTSGTIPTVSATSSGSQITVPSGYIASSQTFPVSGGVDVTSTTAEAGDVRSGKVFYNSAGTLTNGTLVLSGGAEVTLGYITSTGAFQALTFSGTSAADSGSPVYLNCYRWNLPGVEPEPPDPYISSGVIVSSFTSATVSSGYTWLDCRVEGSASLTVNPGGTASGTHINLGSMEVFSGGRAINTTLEIYGRLNVSEGAIASGLSNTSYGQCIVSEGGIAADIFLVYNGAIYVESGGIASDITLGSAMGTADAHPGGSLTRVTVNQGGWLILSSASFCNSCIVSSGGTITQLEGAITSNILVYPGAVSNGIVVP